MKYSGEINSALQQLQEYWTVIGSIALVLALAVSYRIYPSYTLVTLLLLLTFLTSIVLKRLEMNHFGIEFGTLTTITTGAALGPEKGAIIGLIAITLQVFIGSSGSYILWVIPGYVLAGLTAGFLGPSSIKIYGILIVIALQTFFVLSTALLIPENLGRYSVYAAFNVAFNVILFQSVAPQIIGLMV